MLVPGVIKLGRVPVMLQIWHLNLMLFVFLCMCVCVCICKYIYLCTYICVCIYLYMFLWELLKGFQDMVFLPS